MPVTFYIHKDSDLQKILHSDSLNAVTKRTILTRLQQALPNDQGEYAMVFHDDDALHRKILLPDVLVLSEHGIGVLDLCFESGAIFRSEDMWYADGKLIQGNINSGTRSPHGQVQQCAEHIRDLLMTPSRDNTPWLPGRYITWQDLVFDTAICFTNPDANFQHVQSGESGERWERFSTFSLKDLPAWLERLTFEQNLEDQGDVQSYRLSQRYITAIVNDLFEATEVEPIPESQLSPPEPYGYLLLKQHGEIVARFILAHEKMTIGREPSCDVMLPQRYRMVSRIHANLVCTNTGVTIEDMSRNGIFIDGVRVQHSAELLPGQQILLGGNSLVDGVCQLEYSLNPALSQAA